MSVTQAWFSTVIKLKNDIQTQQRRMDGRRQVRKEAKRGFCGRISSSRIFCVGILYPRKKKNKKETPDGNKLAGGVCTEPESLKADLPSKWLNLAFVEARKRSRSLAHNLPQWKSIGSFRTRGLIKRASFFLFFSCGVFGRRCRAEIIKLGSNCSPGFKLLQSLLTPHFFSYILFLWSWR